MTRDDSLGPNGPNGPNGPEGSRVPSVRLVGAHARAQGRVLLRSPAQLVFLLLAPAVALLAIVAPIDALAGDPGQSAQAFAQMAVFGGLAVSVFGLGINAAEERASAWSTYVRTLPASGWIMTAGRLVVTLIAVAGCLVPLTLAALATTALPQALGGWGWAGLGSLLAAWLVAIVGCVPFLGLALIVGYSFSPSTTVAMTQLLVVPLAFAGGLVLPPGVFPPWLEALSWALPTRAAREGVLAALGQGFAGPAWAGGGAWVPALMWAGWAVAARAGAARAYARDEGRRFR